MCKTIPRNAAMKAGALTQAVWSDLHSIQKIHFFFITSSGLVKSAALKTSLLASLFLHINVKADLKRKRQKVLSLETVS